MNNQYETTVSSVLKGDGEVHNYLDIPKPQEIPRKLGNFDFEHTERPLKLIEIQFDAIRTAKTPKFISQSANSPSTRSVEEIAADLEERLRTNSIRRQIHIDNIIKKSRNQNEKVLKVRQKLANQKAKEALEIELQLQQKRQTAQNTRQKIIDDKVAKFRKQNEHAAMVKIKKTVTTLSP